MKNIIYQSILYFRRSLIVRFLLLAVLVSGCTAHQYVTTPHFVPSFTKKGEVKVNLYPRSLQVGYSLSPNFLVYATGFNKSGESSKSLAKENGGSALRAGDAHEVNLGLGYFSNKKGYFTYEILAGGGLGKINYTHKRDLRPDYEFTIKSPKVNAYIQPDVSFILSEDVHMEVGFFTKLNATRYYNLNTQLTLGENSEAYDDDSGFLDRKTVNLLFIEPGVFVRIGGERVKANVQVWNAYNLSGYSMHYRPVNINVGININLEALKKVSE